MSAEGPHMWTHFFLFTQTIILNGPSPLSCGAGNQTQGLIRVKASTLSLGYLSSLCYPHKRETQEGGPRDSHMVKNYTELTPAGWPRENLKCSLHLNLFCTKLGGVVPERLLKELPMVPYGSKPSFPSNTLHLFWFSVAFTCHLLGKDFLVLLTYTSAQRDRILLEGTLSAHTSYSTLEESGGQMGTKPGLLRLWNTVQVRKRKQTLKSTYICLGYS